MIEIPQTMIEEIVRRLGTPYPAITDPWPPCIQALYRPAVAESLGLDQSPRVRIAFLMWALHDQSSESQLISVRVFRTLATQDKIRVLELADIHGVSTECLRPACAA